MICQVKYYKDNLNAYAGRDYTYLTDLPLVPGDKVICPVGNPPQPKRALVMRVDLPETTIDERWADTVKTITEYYVEEGIS